MILGNFLAWKEVFALAGPRYLKVVAFDVGQGDSIFIETPGMHQVLVDGGPGSAVLSRLPKYLPLWDRSLDMIVLTHPDADHLDGLLSVLQKYKVDYILWTGIARNGASYQKWVELLGFAQKRGSKIVIAQKGQKIIFQNITADVLNPQENLEGRDFKSAGNDTSVVLRLAFGQKYFLLTGDISGKAENKLIESQADLKADVLKIAHHGSKYSTTEEFLQNVSPEVAIISSGQDNKYGHPTPEVLQRLEKFGIKVLRTDQMGDVQIISDGNNLAISKIKN